MSWIIIIREGTEFIPVIDADLYLRTWATGDEAYDYAAKHILLPGEDPTKILHIFEVKEGEERVNA